MYFGDEDPALISDTRKTLISNLPLSPEEQQLHQEPAQQTGELKDNHSDQVLMFNEESGSFEYSSGGADVDVSDRSGNEICAVSLLVPLVHHCMYTGAKIPAFRLNCILGLHHNDRPGHNVCRLIPWSYFLATGLKFRVCYFYSKWI